MPNHSLKLMNDYVCVTVFLEVLHISWEQMVFFVGELMDFRTLFVLSTHVAFTLKLNVKSLLGGHPTESTASKRFIIVMHSWSKSNRIFRTKGILLLYFFSRVGIHSCIVVLELKSYPVVIMFQWLYRLAVEEVPENDYMLPLSEAEVCWFILALVTF